MSYEQLNQLQNSPKFDEKIDAEKAKYVKCVVEM